MEHLALFDSIKISRMLEVINSLKYSKIIGNICKYYDKYENFLLYLYILLCIKSFISLSKSVIAYMKSTSNYLKNYKYSVLVVSLSYYF